MLCSYELFVPKVCCHFRVFAPARKEPRRPLKSEIEKRKKNRKKRKRKKKNKEKGGNTTIHYELCSCLAPAVSYTYHICAHV